MVWGVYSSGETPSIGDVVRSGLGERIVRQINVNEIGTWLAFELNDTGGFAVEDFVLIRRATDIEEAMNDEIKTAAERLRRVRRGESLEAVYIEGPPRRLDVGDHLTAKECRDRDWQNIVHAYLNEHPADDDEPIDYAALLAQGGKQISGTAIYKWDLPVENPTVRASLSVDRTGTAAIRVVQDVPLSDVARVTTFIPLPKVTNRAQLRDLCKLLGIAIS